MGRVRRVAYWLTIAALLGALIALARYDQWLLEHFQLPMLSLGAYGIIIYLEARWISSRLRAPLAQLLWIALLAELTSILLSLFLLPHEASLNLLWILHSLDLLKETIAQNADGGQVLKHLGYVFAMSGWTVIFAVVTETLVYVLALKDRYGPMRVFPVVLSANIISYSFLALTGVALVLLFSLI